MAGKKATKTRTEQAVTDALRKMTRAERERERYATDPAYRAAKRAKNAAWKAKNREKQREYNAKWQAQHGADASKRYRQRKQENEDG